MERTSPTGEELKRRLLVIRVAVAVLFAVIWLRLWHMQVWQHDVHAETSLSKLQIERSVAAPRGRIFDREMQPLAEQFTSNTGFTLSDL